VGDKLGFFVGLREGATVGFLVGIKVEGLTEGFVPQGVGLADGADG